MKHLPCVYFDRTALCGWHAYRKSPLIFGRSKCLRAFMIELQCEWNPSAGCDRHTEAVSWRQLHSPTGTAQSNFQNAPAAFIPLGSFVMDPRREMGAWWAAGLPPFLEGISYHGDKRWLAADSAPSPHDWDLSGHTFEPCGFHVCTDTSCAHKRLICEQSLVPHGSLHTSCPHDSHCSLPLDLCTCWNSALDGSPPFPSFPPPIPSASCHAITSSSLQCSIFLCHSAAQEQHMLQWAWSSHVPTGVPAPSAVLGWARPLAVEWAQLPSSALRTCCPALPLHSMTPPGAK